MSKKLWGGRFKKKTDPSVERFTRSVQYDYRLAPYDVAGSLIHVNVLERARFLNKDEAKRLRSALEGILRRIESGGFKPDMRCEDIHTEIQNEVRKKTGRLALKLHTTRSRNDQVAFASRLYARCESEKITGLIERFTQALDKKAKDAGNTVIPGYTHLQHAQPVYLKDHLRAYRAMLLRDKKRLANAAGSIDFTLGSGALGGTAINSKNYSFKIKRILGLKDLSIKPTSNSIDSVSDRDFIIEILSCFAIMGMHISRLCEDLIIWSSMEFGFVSVDECYCTGSSLLPQKKNPDALELARGYSGELSGGLVSVLTMMKGLPLAYNRDMQLDKRPFFRSFDIISEILSVLTGLIGTISFNAARIEAALRDESLYAPYIAQHLVDSGVPFKHAHTIVGRMIRYCEESDKSLSAMTQAEIRRFTEKLRKEDLEYLLRPYSAIKTIRSVKR